MSSGFPKTSGSSRMWPLPPPRWAAAEGNDAIGEDYAAPPPGVAKDSGGEDGCWLRRQVKMLPLTSHRECQAPFKAAAIWVDQLTIMSQSRKSPNGALTTFLMVHLWTAFSLSGLINP